MKARTILEAAFPNKQQKKVNERSSDHDKREYSSMPSHTGESSPRRANSFEDMEPKEFLKAHQICPKMYGLDPTKINSLRGGIRQSKSINTGPELSFRSQINNIKDSCPTYQGMTSRNVGPTTARGHFSVANSGRDTEDRSSMDFGST